MATYSIKKLVKAIHAIAIEEGDILFLDRNIIDIITLAQEKWPKDTPEIMMIGVDVPPGMNVRDTICKMSKDEIAELLKRD